LRPLASALPGKVWGYYDVIDRPDKAKVLGIPGGKFGERGA